MTSFCMQALILFQSAGVETDPTHLFQGEHIDYAEIKASCGAQLLRRRW